jgi:hypothetical protein
MDENLQDKTGSIPPATTTDVPVSSKEKVGMPKHNGVLKRMNPGAKFFKTWATPIGAIVAAIIAVSGFIFGVYHFNAQQSANQAQALDQQRQTTLDTYLDRMSDLLLTSHLAVSKPSDEVRVIAEAQTYTAVRNLDGLRKGILVRFLWEANLIETPQPIISLFNADLSEAIFTSADLSGANLSGADLIGAIFTSDVGSLPLSPTCLCNPTQGSVSDLSNINLSRAEYNTKNEQEGTLTFEPTQWPQGFDPKVTGANCVDC